MSEQTKCDDLLEPVVLSKEEEICLALRKELPEYVVQSYIITRYT